ncbi:hypothetical protein [Halomonas sp. LBP4]|uniref:hypothetical protein n=1 Tax=Halomonas sp. LBP4 TaxID=2044917 RepID=UPI0015E89B70|nr:hypothetical protein [Halomonas sp. LBP4]
MNRSAVSLTRAADGLAIAHATHNRFFADTLVSLEVPITYGQRLARGLGIGVEDKRELMAVSDRRLR